MTEEECGKNRPPPSFVASPLLCCFYYQVGDCSSCQSPICLVHLELGIVLNSISYPY